MLSKNKVKSIQNLYQKKFRDIERQFIVEGDKIVKEVLLQNKSMVIEIWALQEWVDKNIQLLHSVPHTVIDESNLKRISNQKTPNQAIALLQMRESGKPDSFANQWVLVLDGIQDPGNMGTLIRLADWYGIETIVCSENTVDFYNPKVLQSSMGSFLNVALLYENLEQFLEKHASLNINAAVLNGDDVRSLLPSGEGVLVIGNEGNGISKNLLPFCQKHISITRKGKAESLNAAMATGILLSHLIR
jgi:RNA methyltransferase, TrmH family